MQASYPIRTFFAQYAITNFLQYSLAQDFTASAAWLAQQCRATHICHAFISSNRNLMHRPNDAAAFHTILRMMQDCQFSAYGVHTPNLASSKTATLRDKWRLRRYLTPDGKVCAVLF